MSLLVYDNNNALNFGSITKTKNGVLIKSYYPASIKNYCLNWENVQYVLDEILLDCSPTYLFFTSPSNLEKNIKKEINELIFKHPGSSIYIPNLNIIIGSDMKLNLQICIFHGLKILSVPISVDSILDKYQTKMFKKICVR